ncbi:MAG TPA: sulfotransferase [Streptosporangiaceae bacterium]
MDATQASQAPVIVLTVARSGSTLLRFILDTHPELACPPETNIGQVCVGLARLRKVLDPPADSAQGEFLPGHLDAEIAPEAAAWIRAAITGAYGPYLVQHGKRRWCDKSLDNARAAGLLARVFPAAQFVCLYRHCMDVVASAIEATPWGLNGYGFDPYIRATPGNSVAAAAHCWLDQTKSIIEFQEKYPDRCHGIRYEDLVSRPEEITESLFAFLGVKQIPGITTACFATEHDMRGPADHKIWFTKRVSPESVGRGARVPKQLVLPDMLAAINEALAQLDYRQVDDHWARLPDGFDPRANSGCQAAEFQVADHKGDPFDAVVKEISSRLASVPSQQASRLMKRWPVAAQKTLAVEIQPQRSSRGHRWTLRFTGSEMGVEEDTGSEVPTAKEEAAGQDGDAFLTGPAATWHALLTGQANMATELRTGRLRLARSTPRMPAMGAPDLPEEINLISHLIGLAGEENSEETWKDGVVSLNR